MPPASRRPRSRQAELFPRSKRSVIEIAPTHRLVLITEETDWTALEEIVQEIRRRKLKNEAGRPPHLRALIGAVVFRALRRMTYRETEDQIRHYGPARYLCGLTETNWTPDANTIQDFEQLLGEDGVKKLNEHVVKWAVEEKLGDPTIAAADTTAQEAAVPYPNEMGLMATFVSAITAASKNVGAVLSGFVKKAGGLIRAAKTKLRDYRLFAKKKSKAVRDRLVSQMASTVEKIQDHLASALGSASQTRRRFSKWRKSAWQRIQRLHETMKTLLPQVRHWLRTGFVAKDKIVSLYIPEIYSLVRGKVGKPVEFGVNWGIARIGGGFLIATRAKDKLELWDSRFALRAVEEHVATFGAPPEAYAYDHAGSSEKNATALKTMGVKHVGLAPRGQMGWQVSGSIKDRLVRERAQVEAGIGSIKCAKYGFNRPAARSVEAMGVAGQRSVLGFNLNKLMNGLAERRGLVLVG
jgi:transposase, IS5 family